MIFRDGLPGVIYDQVVADGQFFDDEFKAAVRLSGDRVRIETLQAGVPAFYRIPDKIWRSWSMRTVETLRSIS